MTRIRDQGAHVATTLIIIALTCIISFMAFSNRQLLDSLILWPPAVQRGQYYRLLSYGLIHADGTHLLFNMFTLFFFGRAMEPLYTALLGPFGFAVFYVLGLLASILPTWLANRNNAGYRSLGASGAVSAVLFAYILIAPWSLIYLYFIPVPAIVFAVAYIAYSVYMDHKGGGNINHSAHLWGAAYGVIFTIIMQPRVLSLFVDRLLHPVWA
ncbi:MAG: rhomboid family intramembrane serine protease [Rhodanobacteraceae bacterium]